ncbi:hypothetical protein CB1_000925002 [Camelus ferus]|nr:hypothetical protein CB1_000925002 [Camelus ferus]
MILFHDFPKLRKFFEGWGNSLLYRKISDFVKTAREGGVEGRLILPAALTLASAFHKMAADSEPESEVFEITDFTTASEWERFISKVEEVLNDWKLIGNSLGKPLEKGIFTSGTWEEKSDEISFADFKFSVTHHYLVQESTDKEGKDEVLEDTIPQSMQDLLCMNNDFPPRAHCLVRWYGLREFVVIAPAANNDAVLSESKCNLLLSSVSIALGNTGCQVPLFVQIHHKWRRMYVGECQGPGVRTDFEMVHLRKVPNQYTHLSDIDALVGGEVGGLEFGKLPFGACEDPISDLDPIQAPHWSVRVRKADNPQCLLGDFVTEFFKICRRKESTDEILGRSTFEEEGRGDAGKAGDQLGPDSLKDTEKEKGEVGKSWDSWSDSEEEFFECLSDTEEFKGNGQESGKKGGPKEVANLKPEGRLYQHGKLTLLHNGEPLYIPVTQEPAPMTEDLLEEQSEVLAKLGTSAEGAHLRARMQSACLLSDMESFKAANPGCFLEDFVRWYSPRDYIEEEVIDEKGNMVLKGELSARMKIPSNMWVEAWETAKPIPARRQRRLFDDTREAEKVLHYLAVQKPADLARHLLPCVIHAAVLKEIIHQIINVEAIIARARSLKAKFGTEKCEQEEEKEDLERFVNCLLEQPEVLVVGAGRGHAGRIIHKLFVNAQRAAAMAPPEEDLKRMGSLEERRPNSASDFPPPAGRELILRTTVPRPAPYSRALPQRMYSVLTKEDFRLAGAFSSDTSFF